LKINNDPRCTRGQRVTAQNLIVREAKTIDILVNSA
jgi:hypothetical protein